jgi:lipid-A-disaccharide synthase-like uncharacterized protein
MNKDWYGCKIVKWPAFSCFVIDMLYLKKANVQTLPVSFYKTLNVLTAGGVGDCSYLRRPNSS